MMDIVVRINGQNSSVIEWLGKVIQRGLEKFSPTRTRTEWNVRSSWKKSSMPRKEIVADLLHTNKHTVIVRLPDGNVVKRKLARDVV